MAEAPPWELLLEPANLPSVAFRNLEFEKPEGVLGQGSLGEREGRSKEEDAAVPRRVSALVRNSEVHRSVRGRSR